jgi:nitroreductase
MRQAAFEPPASILPSVDANLAVVSKREVREYLDRPVAEDVLTKILQAGRAAGSSKNTQPWRFVILKDRQHRHDLANAIMAPRNLDRCAVAIAVVLLNERLRFDAGRVAQNLMVAAWALGIGSCPNSVRPDEHDGMRKDLGVPADAAIATIITLGYPAPGQPRPRTKADPEKIVAKLNRLPLEELVHRERFNG